MKLLLFSAIIAGLLTAISSCKEVGPNINLHGNANSVSDTTYIESPVAAPESRNVLIEEFTGVNCPNCPAGHALEASIESSYAPGKVVGVALHPINSLGTKFPFSLQNLEDPYAGTLLSILGNPGAEPCAAIDRVLFAGQSYIPSLRDYWSSFVTQEMTSPTQVNLALSDMYNASNGVVTVVAQIHYTQNVSQPNNITIELTEDSVVTAQLDGSVIDTFYVHNNVLRSILTSTTGDNVAYNANVTLVEGRVIQLVYQDTISSQWNPQHMSVVAFVHEHANSQIVYQSRKISLVN